MIKGILHICRNALQLLLCLLLCGCLCGLGSRFFDLIRSVPHLTQQMIHVVCCNGSFRTALIHGILHCRDQNLLIYLIVDCLVAVPGLQRLSGCRKGSIDLIIGCLDLIFLISGKLCI